jgi:bacterioferritin (cytochrome b1)
MNKDKMIQMLNDDLKNEWKHLRFYLYHASAVTGLHCAEYKELFLKEAASEMLHVSQFSDVIIGLGGTATFESNDFGKYTDPKDIMEYAVAMEEEVVNNYVQRMKDADDLGGVDGTWLEIFLEGQVQASREDLDHFKQIVRGL